MIRVMLRAIWKNFGGKNQEMINTLIKKHIVNSTDIPNITDLI